MLRGVCTLPTCFLNDDPEEIPHSQGPFGMTCAEVNITLNNYVARRLHATNSIPWRCSGGDPSLEEWSGVPLQDAARGA